MENRVCTDPELLALLPGIREEYSMTVGGGVIPESVLHRLPASCDAWENLVEQLPALNKSRRLRAAIDAMPLLDLDTVLPNVKMEELWRANVILSQLCNSYCHGPGTRWDLIGGVVDEDTSSILTLPKQVAKPYFQVCQRLGLPVVLTQAVDMWNWRILDPSLPREPKNMDLISSMTGTQTERFFHMVPHCMLHAAAAVLPKLFAADLLVAKRKFAALGDLFRELTDVLERVNRIFRDISKVEPAIFFDVSRPLLGGFWPTPVLLQGISMVEAKAAAAAGEVGNTTFAEVSATSPTTTTSTKSDLNAADAEEGVLAFSKGPSAGQSTMFFVFDIFLGVSHGEDGREFQEDMIGYLPAPHRALVLDYRAKWHETTPVRQFVEQNKNAHPELAQAFDQCVQKLADVRKFHLATVRRQLVKAEVGTGGSSWKVLLEAMLHGTKETALRCPLSAFAPGR